MKQWTGIAVKTMWCIESEKSCRQISERTCKTSVLSQEISWMVSRKDVGRHAARISR